MADLGEQTNEYLPDDGFPLQLRGIDEAELFNDDGTPMTITVLGADSDVAVKARNATSNRRYQQGPRMKLTAEGIEADQAAYLAKLTIDWDITMGGDKPAFSQAAAVQLYRNPKLSFIREQVDAAIADRTNFLKRSA